MLGLVEYRHEGTFRVNTMPDARAGLTASREAVFAFGAYVAARIPAYQKASRYKARELRT
jgi:hypothetical protein